MSGYCFVANQGSRSIAVVSLERFRVVRQIPLDAAPATVLAHPHRPRVLVLAPENGTVYEVDGATYAVSRKVRAGNFIILRPDEQGERIPLTIADWDTAAGTVSSIFVQVGASTAKLARLKAGDTIPSYAGCYGLGSLYPIARALTAAGNKVYAMIEARSSYLLYWQERLAAVVERLIVVTRDGSRGYKGHVTRLSEILALEKISPDRVIAHGCTFQMMTVAKETKPLGIKTIVSMNPIMIDGTGMCGVCRLTVAGQTKFACVDGPEFDGHEVDWEEFFARREGYSAEENEPLHRSGCASHF